MNAFFTRTSFIKIFLTKFLLFLCSIIIYSVSSATIVHAQIETSHQSGTVNFSGQHAGMNFEGKFERWQATLILPPHSNTHITATFYMDSARTGDSIYDSTLPEYDWFDVENHAIAKFVSTNIVVIDESYHVTGNLTLKGITNPISFILTNIDDKLTTTFDVNRLAYKIGFESDPDAEWGSKTISISMAFSK
jgi:polyisoprenoid-binding protein YceI